MTVSPDEWVRRDVPLLPSAVLGVGDVAAPLASAAASLRRLGREVRAVSGPSQLLVLGREDDLPWVDGAVFLGWDNGMLLPTTYAPPVHPDLLAQALRQKLGPGDLAVTPTQVVQYSLSNGSADVAWLDAYASGSST